MKWNIFPKGDSETESVIAVYIDDLHWGYPFNNDDPATLQQAVIYLTRAAERHLAETSKHE